MSAPYYTMLYRYVIKCNRFQKKKKFLPQTWKTELSPFPYYWLFCIPRGFLELAHYSLSKTGHIVFYSVFLGFFVRICSVFVHFVLALLKSPSPSEIGFGYDGFLHYSPDTQLLILQALVKPFNCKLCKLCYVILQMAPSSFRFSILARSPLGMWLVPFWAATQRLLHPAV